MNKYDRSAEPARAFPEARRIRPEQSFSVLLFRHISEYSTPFSTSNLSQRSLYEQI